MVAQIPEAHADEATGRQRPAASVVRAWLARRGTVLAIGVLVVCFPLLAAAWSILFGDVPYARSGDIALVQIAVSDAEHFRQQLGTYSRCGWHDPGPAWFYLLVPVYALGGSTGASLEISALFLQAVALSLCLVTATWKQGRLAIILCAAVLATFVSVLPSYVFTIVWNPFFMIAPALLTLLLCARAAAGSWVSLGGAALLATITVQAHVGTVYYVVALLAVSSVACAYVTVRARGSWTRPSRRALLIGGAGAGLAVVAWIPPLVEQFSSTDGNLSQLIAFARDPMANQLCTGSGATNAAHPLGEAVSVTTQGFTLFPLGHTLPPTMTGTLTAGSVVTLVLYLAGAGALAGFAYRAGQRIAAWTGALAFLAMVVAVYSTMHANGVIGYYLVVWYSTIPVAAALGWAALLSGRPRRLGGWAGELARRAESRGVLLGAAGVATLSALATATSPLVTQAEIGDTLPSGLQVTATVVSHLPARPPAGDRRVLIVLGSHDSWPVATALVLNLRHRGWQPQVTPDWQFMFGSRYTETAGVPDRVFTLSLATKEAPPAGGRLLGTVDAAYIAGTPPLAVYENVYSPGEGRPDWFQAPPFDAP